MSRWRTLDGHEAASFESELRRELPAGHVLHGREVRAIAASKEDDDVAFRVIGAGLVVVHLTWRVETDPQWPCARFVDDLSDEDV